MSQIPVGIIGTGVISELHWRAHQKIKEAEVAALCDLNEAVVQSKAKKWGVQKIYTDYNALLADPEIQAVEILTPQQSHKEIAVAALKAGKHVSVQKPMALSSAEADEMINAAHQAGVVLRVYENFVYYAPAIRARQMIEAGEIGALRAIRLHVSTGTVDSSWNVPLSAWLWRFNEKQCGGGPLVFDHGYHLFSLAYYLGGPVERVYAWIDKTPVSQAGGIVSVDAPAVIMFQYKSPRCYGMLDIEHTPKMRINSLYYADDDRIEIVGEKGILFINRYTAKTVDLME